MKQLDDSVIVWIARVSESINALPLLEPLLDERERERAAQFRFPEDRFRFTLGRALARKGLGQFLARSPESIEFILNDRGRPVLKVEEGIHFSISHSGDWVAVAFAKNARVGLDIERVDRKVDLMGVAERILSAQDFAKFCALPDEEKVAAFFRVWTRKEAYLKATGEGITDALRKISVSLSAEEPSFITDARDIAGSPKWRMHSLALSDGYATCVACDDAAKKIVGERVNAG